MDGTLTSLQVQIASAHDSDAAELNKLAQGLRREILARRFSRSNALQQSPSQITRSPAGPLCPIY
jgi:hypothetical protein